MDDEKLLQLIEHEPDKGLHEAMRMYGRSVNTICHSVLKGYEDGLVDEAVSETFFKLWKNCGQFSLGRETRIKSWLYSIARNTAIDIRRKNGYNMVSINDENAPDLIANISLENEVQRKELKQILHEVIALLGEPDDQVFLCKYFMCMKNKEIAKRLQISEKKTENILYRGKSKLREMLLERGMTCYED